MIGSGFHCSHGYPEGEYCPACGEIPVIDHDHDEHRADCHCFDCEPEPETTAASRTATEEDTG